jgi:hypothetical protein
MAMLTSHLPPPEMMLLQSDQIMLKDCCVESDQKVPWDGPPAKAKSRM